MRASEPGTQSPLRLHLSIPAALAFPFYLLACGDATGVDDLGVACTDQIGTVTVTVSGGLTPNFSWSPACDVALFLIEEDAGDMWAISTDDSLWDDPAMANRIRSPVSYGTVQAGSSETQAVTPLTTGTTYEVVLWRILPASSTAPCLARFETACLMAVHEFVP